MLEASENFQKKSFRNRYRILGANGTMNLSIPLIKGKNQKTNIKNVEIAYYDPWYANHIHSIQSAYGNAPFFIYYADEVFELLRSGEPSLYNFNRNALELILRLLAIDIQIKETTEFLPFYKDFIDLRNSMKIRPQEPINSEFPYIQVFEDKFGFVSGLSILDLLFNLGPEAKLYLDRIAK
jgi:hypothetical protein